MQSQRFVVGWHHKKYIHIIRITYTKLLHLQITKRGSIVMLIRLEMLNGIEWHSPCTQWAQSGRHWKISQCTHHMHKITNAKWWSFEITETRILVACWLLGLDAPFVMSPLLAPLSTDTTCNYQLAIVYFVERAQRSSSSWHVGARRKYPRMNWKTRKCRVENNITTENGGNKKTEKKYLQFL